MLLMMTWVLYIFLYIVCICMHIYKYCQRFNSIFLFYLSIVFLFSFFSSYIFYIVVLGVLLSNDSLDLYFVLCKGWPPIIRGLSYYCFRLCDELIIISFPSNSSVSSQIFLDSPLDGFSSLNSILLVSINHQPNNSKQAMEILSRNIVFIQLTQ